jgi:hypothetical protein
MNLKKPATHATSATHFVKLLICNTIVCSRYEVSTCYTFFVPATHLHYPVEGEALEHREHEHRTEEHDVRFADREPRFTTPSS